MATGILSIGLGKSVVFELDFILPMSATIFAAFAENLTNYIEKGSVALSVNITLKKFLPKSFDSPKILASLQMMKNHGFCYWSTWFSGIQQ